MDRTRGRQLAARIAIAASLLVACMVLASGCGMGDGAAEDGPRALSKREYIERSNELQAQAADVFAKLDGPVAATPKDAAQYLTALDELHAGLGQLNPPAAWEEHHATLVESVRIMREAMAIVSRASARNERVIKRQLQRSADAQREYEQAVQAINASR